MKTIKIVVCLLCVALTLSGCSGVQETLSTSDDVPSQVVTLMPFASVSPADTPNANTPTQSITPTPTTPPTAETPIPTTAPTPQPTAPAMPPHDGFVYVTEVIPDVILDMRYYGTNNFVGARVDGYESPVALLTVEAAEALKLASDDLRLGGYSLKIFDAYRPQRAVEHFINWAADMSDQLTKADFYPDMDKSRLFAEGFIAKKSAHSRGSTVDLTIVDIRSGMEVDMGAPFDFFGPISSHGTALITEEQTANRLILKQAMEKAGFSAYLKEWWHYILIDEPYPDTYFDFPVD